MFAGDDEAHQARALARMKEASDNAVLVEPLRGAFWNRVKKRSTMNNVHTVQMFQLAKQAGFALGPGLADMKDVARKHWSGITQSKLVEDGVRDERVDESSRKSFNKTMSGERCWKKLLDAKTEHLKHRFTRLPFETMSVPRGEKDKPVAELFKVHPKDVPKQFKAVIGTSATAPYNSPAPLFVSAPVEDAALIQWCVKQKRLDQAHLSWWCVLGRLDHLLLRHPRVFGGKWFIACSTSGNHLLMGIPVTTKNIGGTISYIVEKIDQLYFIPVLSPKEFTARIFEWRSPLWVRVFTGRWMKDNPYVLWPVGEAGNLLQISVRNGCGDIPKGGLQRICREEAVDFQPSDGVPELLIALASKVLGQLTQREKLAILRFRVPLVDEASLFLKSEEAQEFLEEHDKEEIMKSSAGKPRLSEATKEMKAAIKKMVQPENGEPGAGGLSSASTTARGSNRSDAVSSSGSGASGVVVPPLKKARKYLPKMGITDAATEEYVESLLPPGCRFYKDVLDGSWRLSAYGGRYSAAWRLYGFEGSAMKLAQTAWQAAIDLGFEERCPFPEILMD